MSNVPINISYDLDFIEGVQTEISKKIAKLVNKKNSYRRFDIRGSFNNYDIIKLTKYSEILTAITQCSDCYKDMEIEPTIGKIKNLLNKIK